MKKWKIITIICVALAVLVVGGFYLYINNLKEELATYVLPQTTFEGEDVTGKTEAEVEQLVADKIREYEGRTVELVIGEDSATYTWKELGVQFTGTDVAEQIFTEQTTGSVNQLRKMRQAAKKGERTRDFALTIDVDTNQTAEAIKEEHNDVLQAPVNATFHIPTGTRNIEITPSTEGTMVDKEKLEALLVEAVLTGENTIEAPLKTVAPDLTTEEVKNLQFDVVSEFRTSLKGRNPNQIHNVSLAASRLTGTVLAPGEIFSHKERVGYVDTSTGYKDAPVFGEGGVVEEAPGGGVCQLSSTLYVATLLADGHVVSRTNHSRTVSYVPVGLDATVANYGPDYQFKNNTPSYLYIHAWVEGGEVVVRFLGIPTGKEIKLSSKIESETDEKLVVVSYRTVIENGVEVVSNERIVTSTYIK